VRLAPPHTLAPPTAVGGASVARQQQHHATLVHGLRCCPAEEAADTVGPEEHLHLLRMATLRQPVSVVAVLHHVELRVAIAGWVGQLGT